MANIIDVIFGEKEVYAYFDGPEPTMENFNVKYGALNTIIDYINDFGSSEIGIGTALTEERTNEYLKRICKKCSYHIGENRILVKNKD